MKKHPLRRSLVALLVVAFAMLAVPATALAQPPRVPAVRANPTQVSQKARPRLRLPARPPAATPAKVQRPTLHYPNVSYPALRLPALRIPKLPSTTCPAPVIPAKLPNVMTYGHTPLIIPAKLPPLVIPQFPAH